MQFADRNDALLWIIKNQLGRRNLSAYDRSILALRLKPVIAAKAKENQAEYHGNQYESGLIPTLGEVQKPIRTDKEIAKAAGVSHGTLAKVEKIEAEATPEIKAALRTGDLSINAAYDEIKRAEKSQRRHLRGCIVSVELGALT